MAPARRRNRQRHCATARPSGRCRPASARSSPRTRSAPGEAKRIVEVREVARVGKELEPAGRYQPMGRARVLDRDDRVAPSAPALGSSGSAAGLPEPPFLRLPFGRDIDRQARIDQRGARIAPPSAAQEARRAPPPRLESSLRLPLDSPPDGGEAGRRPARPGAPRAILAAASSRSLLKRDDPRAGLAAASDGCESDAGANRVLADASRLVPSGRLDRGNRDARCYAKAVLEIGRIESSPRRGGAD
jgi:hypothetical protein